jgi:hypothetical protein
VRYLPTDAGPYGFEMLFCFLAEVDFLWLPSHDEYSFGEECPPCCDTFGHEGIDLENHFDEVFQYQITCA